MKIIELKKGKEKSILRKHPWIFSGAIHTNTSDFEEGEIVQVNDAKGKFLAYGHFQIGSISVRAFEFDEKAIVDEAYWKGRIKECIDLRISLDLIGNENTNIFRLVHAEGDGLPGLVIDVYNETAVIQCHSIGMWNERHLFAKQILSLLPDSIKSVYDKSAETLPFKAEISPENGYLIQSDSINQKAKEYGVIYNLDWEGGQKTGFFIDQRENRKLLGNYSRNKKVLNTFCYSGGFSLAALDGGAKEVHSLDSSKKAIELVEANLNNFKLKEGQVHKSIVADAVKHIKNLDEHYDIIVLDPPAFAKHVKARHNAIQAYKRLNKRAIEQLNKGGLLFTFSCSQVVTKDLFKGAVLAAALEVGKKVRILHYLSQPADHPINIYHPESEYLKGLVLQID